MAGGLDDVAALAVGGQQHGMVCLDEAGAVVRDALLWNDVRSAGAAADLITELGDGDSEAGPAAWAEAVGLVPVASFTGTKLRWLADAEPEAADRTAAVCLPHDWLTWRLRGRPRPRLAGHRPRGRQRHRVLVGAHRRVPAGPAGARDARPPPRGPARGRTSRGGRHVRRVGGRARSGHRRQRRGRPGAGRPAGRRRRLDRHLRRRLGRHRHRRRRSSGTVAGFADATGRHLPLVATLNAARVLDAAAALLGVDHATLSDLALSAPSGAGGLVLVPYLEGERTPNLPQATGSVHGLTLRTSTPAYWARAAVEGLLCGLADGIEAVVARGVPVERVLLVGGAASSPAVQQLAPGIFGRPVLVPPPGEYVADGAARQAAWVLSGDDTPPEWAQPGLQEFDAPPATAVRERYAEVRGKTDGQ